MAHARHLRNAPIREALVDIAVKIRPETQLDLLASLQALIGEEFSIRQEIRSAEVEVDLTQETNKVINTPVGYMFRTSDQKRVVQFKLNGFTFNWLRPYTDWNDLRAHALRMWQIYSEALQPEKVTRLALRYINQLELPIPAGDFSEYLAAQPNIPPALPQKVSNFFTRVAIHDDLTDCGAIITQVYEGLVNPKVFPLILDIDASKSVSLPSNAEEIWTILDQLRDFKNRIFFESLTEDAVRIFE